MVAEAVQKPRKGCDHVVAVTDGHAVERAQVGDGLGQLVGVAEPLPHPEAARERVSVDRGPPGHL